MKVQFIEHDESFYIGFQAETIKEAATLVRFSLNSKRDPLMQNTFALSDSVHTQMYFKKRKDSTNEISR